jgi:hypothetical protein
MRYTFLHKWKKNITVMPSSLVLARGETWGRVLGLDALGCSTSRDCDPEEVFSNQVFRVWCDTHMMAQRSICMAHTVDGFRVARTRGTTRRTQRFERRGLNVGDLGSQRNTVTEASSHRTHNTLQRETPSFTQVQGPRGEVKPLLPAFLYYDAIPREEYKVLVTEL